MLFNSNFIALDLDSLIVEGIDFVANLKKAPLQERRLIFL